jgi:hypothetical protein
MPSICPSISGAYERIYMQKNQGIFCGKVPLSRSYGSTAALRLIVKTSDEDEEKDDLFFYSSK